MDRDWKVWKNVAYPSGLWFPLSPKKIVLRLSMSLSAMSLLSYQIQWVLISFANSHLGMHWISPWGLWRHSPPSCTTDITWPTLLPESKQRFMPRSLSAGSETRVWKQRGFYVLLEFPSELSVLSCRLRSPFCPVPYAEMSGRKSHCGSA